MKTVTKSDIAALSVSKEGTYIAGGDEDGIVHIWDVRKPTEHLLQIQRDLYPITSMCSIHTEKQDLIAVGSQNGSLYTINGFGFGFADSRDRGNESYENSGSSKLTGIKTDTEFVGFGSGAINGIKCLYGGHRNLLNDYTLHVTAGCDGSIYKI
ncbi:hypothetical protein AX774_g4958 [Zancudomyces culisetae]|uniref:Uncharacterized protein n=1 Tax=Zancudomyces culisetae TaxID=1213189 RepID=A0A1R1PKV1_ZANCU|nr:hypothetical protein AX774_g4958 [Zancudomyces culisetae]|eukprot:OMH81567.1 hypothetical protein AX774_g4958 [Zancudomyces culisetae]